MRSNGRVVSAFSRVRKSWPNLYTEAVQTSKVPENPREAWDSATAGGWREDTNYSNKSNISISSLCCFSGLNPLLPGFCLLS